MALTLRNKGGYLISTLLLVEFHLSPCPLSLYLFSSEVAPITSSYNSYQGEIFKIHIKKFTEIEIEHFVQINFICETKLNCDWVHQKTIRFFHNLNHVKLSSSDKNKTTIIICNGKTIAIVGPCVSSFKSYVDTAYVSEFTLSEFLLLINIQS